MQEQKRFHYLDAARGIAAMMVLVGHYINWKFEHVTGVKWLTFIFNPNDAVSFFFVLSGFVLTYPYLNTGRSLDLGRFYTNRIFRLYPGFFVAFIINYLYSIKYELNLSGFSKALFHNYGDFWYELFLMRGFHAHYLPGWTLAVEMAASFMIPFLIIIARRNAKLLLWMLPIIIICAGFISPFAFHFMLGVLIAQYFDWLSEPQLRSSKLYKYRWALIVAAFVLFSLRVIHRVSPLGSFLIEMMNFTKLDFTFWSGIASFVFIISCLQFRGVQRVLESKILLFYGRISYGIYLVHWVLVRFIFDYWDRLNAAIGLSTTSNFIIILFALVALSTLLATMLYYFVELSFIKLGKRVAAKMKPTIAI